MLVLIILSISVFVTCCHSNFAYRVKLEGFITLKYFIISKAREISWLKSSYSYRTSGHYVEYVSALYVYMSHVCIGDMNLNSVCACGKYLNFNIAPFCSVFVCFCLTSCFSDPAS